MSTGIVPQRILAFFEDSEPPSILFVIELIAVDVGAVPLPTSSHEVAIDWMKEMQMVYDREIDED